MDAQHIHLLFNHFPIVGTLIAAVVLTVALLLRKQPLITAGLWMLVAFAILAIPVFLSGEGAEDAINSAGATHDYIEAHEHAAELAFYLILGLGVFAIFTLLIQWMRIKIARALAIITVIYAWGVFADMAYVGNLGGQIRHEEIRDSSIIVTPATDAEDNDDDDYED